MNGLASAAMTNHEKFSNGALIATHRRLFTEPNVNGH